MSKLPAPPIRVTESATQSLAEIRQAANRRLVRWLVVGVIGAFAFAFTLVPLYKVFCEVTGFNGKGKLVNASNQIEADKAINSYRLVTVEFTGTVMPGLAWEVKPVENSMEVRPGDLITAYYEVRNLSGHALIGHAVPSVSPMQAAQHFRKLECFCFTSQTLQAYERKQLPVTFMVSPKLDGAIRNITLSYALFNNNR